ncbi:MAG: glutamine--fructose-6-phosphate transaminase (isomerizing) [Leptospirales bacterium]
MCGIVGYIGPKAVDSFLIVGLKKLEYRGYDSAGIALIDRDELVVRKRPGKISELEDELNDSHLKGSLGIGHTRWATHGEPTQANAHPHSNQNRNIAVVHNGIIENFSALRKELGKTGVVFVSQTDTEVIPYLIEAEYAINKNIEQAFKNAITHLEGKFSIAMITEFEPGKIFFAKSGAPLIVAKNSETGEVFLASDLPAIVPIAQQAYYVLDEEWGYLENNSIELKTWAGEPKEIIFEKIDINNEDYEIGNFPHYMLKEIFEQPKVIKTILENRISPSGEIVFEELNFDNEYLASIGRIIIQACGTSLIAGLVGKYYFEHYGKIFTDADYSSEFRYRNPVIDGDTLVIGISQSGETADTIAGIHEAKSKFLKVISFLNNPKSTMARESDGTIHLFAGPEIGVASTKAYTAELVNLALFSLYLGKIKGVVSKEEQDSLIKEIQQIPEMIESVLHNDESIKVIAEYLKPHHDAVFLGRTFNYPTALEGALKLKEISYIHASGYAAGEFKHGPIALVTENMPVIVIAPQSEIRNKVISNLLEVKARKGKIISIISEGDTEIMEHSDYYVEIPKISESLSPILAVIPLQLIAYYTALYRGCNVDKPRNLAKSVTVE